MLYGVDEAGRGPIVGSIVMAAVAVKEESELPPGVKDSKLLSPSQRAHLFEALQDTHHEIAAVPPARIDKRVENNELNLLEADTTIAILKVLRQKTQDLAPKAIIDCPSTNVDSYKEYLQDKLKDWDLIVKHKADADHKVAAAASILAKVTRDNEIEQLKKEINKDFGSGYPADPKTQAFLKTVDLDWPHLRKSWKTYQNEVKRRNQKTLF